MNRRGLVALICALGFGFGPAHAQDYDPASDPTCEKAFTQSELNACVYAGYEAADAQLNKAWKAAVALMADIDAELPKKEQGAVSQLRAGQRAWITFRDATCEAEAYQMHGGSAEPMQRYGCMTRLTAQRSEDLTAMVEMGH